MKKGFTLIELLSVIVILAIIALIATPIVLNIIKDTKESAQLRSAEMYLKRVETSMANSTLNNKKINDNTYQIMNNGDICLTALEEDKCSEESILKVEINGELPISGTVTIENGKIKDIELIYLNKKTIVYNSNKKLIYKEEIKSLLPKEYEQLEYIASTGTQYIDTGIKSSNEVSIISEFSSTNAEQERCYVFGAYGNSDNERIQFSYSNIKVLGWDSQYYRSDGLFDLDLNKHIINASKGDFVLDGTSIYTFNDVTFSSNYNITLFALNARGVIENNSLMQLFNCKIWEGDTLVRDFVPALRKSDGKVGLYDLVSATFFTNLGTENFATNTQYESNFSKEYEQLEYIESTGTQYIDTGIKSSNEISIISEFSSANIEQQRCYVFGVYGNSNERIQFSYSNPEFLGWYSQYSNSNKLFSLDTEKHIINVSKGNFVLDGTSIYTFNDGTFYANYNITLFALNASGVIQNNSLMKLYSCKIWNGKTLVRDFVPALRKSDSKVGLYDKVTQTFFSNQGEGMFIEGKL